MRTRKIAAFLISVMLLSPAMLPAAVSAEQISVQVSSVVNGSTVSISGVLSSGAGKQVTVRVTAPNGTIDYIDQATIEANGTYTFTYTLNTNVQGTYQVAVGGTDVSQVQMTSFQYPAESGGSDPDTGGNDPGTGESGPDTGGSHPNPVNGQTDASIKPSSSSLEQVKRSDGSVLMKAVLTSAELSRAIGKLAGGATQQIVSIDMSEHKNVRLELPAAEVLRLAKSNAQAVLSIAVQGGSYDIPAAALAGALGESGRLAITIGQPLQAVQAELTQQLGNAMLAIPVEYSVQVTNGSSTVELKDFGSYYVTRTLELPKPVNPDIATGVIYDPLTGKIQFVPTVFEQKDGSWLAILKHNGNSVYTVIEKHVSFHDIQGSWAKSDIEKLASKRILQGASEGQFAPEGKVTRAELAAMLVRALGLRESADSASYSDVGKEQWFASTVNTASQAGLINGYGDGSFQPDRLVTREEAAVMMMRAAAFAGGKVTADPASLAFADSGSISAWARSDIAAAVQAKLVNGVTSDTFAPDQTATRAEAAAMLKRMLVHLQFINP